MPGTSKSLWNNSRKRASRCAGAALGPNTWIACWPSVPTKARASWAVAGRGGASSRRPTHSAPTTPQRRIMSGKPPRITRPGSLRDRVRHRVGGGRIAAEAGDRQVRLLVADLRLAPLAGQRANCRIIIERGFLDLGQGFDVARPLVDARRGGAR